MIRGHMQHLKKSQRGTKKMNTEMKIQHLRKLRELGLLEFSKNIFRHCERNFKQIFVQYHFYTLGTIFSTISHPTSGATLTQIPKLMNKTENPPYSLDFFL